MGKKTKKIPDQDTRLPPHMIEAYQESQKKSETIQNQIDKLASKVAAEERRLKGASLAMKFIDQRSEIVNGFFMQLGKCFKSKSETQVKAELGDAIKEAERDIPKLLNAQAQFEILLKDQAASLRAIAETARKQAPTVKA